MAYATGFPVWHWMEITQFRAADLQPEVPSESKIQHWPRKPWDMKVNMTCIGSLQYLKIKGWKIWTNRNLLDFIFETFDLKYTLVEVNPGPFVEQHVFDFRWLQRLLCVSGSYNDSDGMVDAFTIRCGWCSPNSQSWKWFSLWSFSNLGHVKWSKVFGSLDVWY